jgi:hypothetical protein
LAVERSVGFIESGPPDRLGEEAERVIQIDQIIESGLEELEVSGDRYRRVLGLHIEVKLQGVLKKNAVF